MASTSDIINIDTFDNDVSTSGQQTAEVPKEPVVENRVTSFFSQTSQIPVSQRPPDNAYARYDISSWGYDRTFGHFLLDPALAQPSYHQPPYPVPHTSSPPWNSANSTPIPHAFSPPWDSPSSTPTSRTSTTPISRTTSTTPTPHASTTTPVRRDGNTAGVKRGGRTRIQGASQRGRNVTSSKVASSQSTPPTPDVSPISEREMSVENGRVKLETHVKKTQTRNMNKYEKLILI